MAKKSKKIEKNEKKGAKKASKKAVKRDMPAGEDHPNCRLTDEDVEKIRRLYKKGKYTQAELAEKYELSLQYTNRLINKKVRA